MKQKYLTAQFYDEENLIEAIKELRAHKISIRDVMTPFPVHGLDKLLGYRRTAIPTVGFICGALGAIIAFAFQVWVFVVDYPLIIGGKPFLSIPSFIPITFELTVLCAAIGMVLAFLLRSHLGPGAKNLIHDERVTDDCFIVLVELGVEDDTMLINQVKELLIQQNANNIKVKEEKIKD